MGVEKTIYWVEGDSGVIPFELRGNAATADDIVLTISKYRRTNYEFKKSAQQVFVDGDNILVAIEPNLLLRTDNGLFEYALKSVSNHAQSTLHAGLFMIVPSTTQQPESEPKETYSISIAAEANGQDYFESDELIGAAIIAVIRIAQPLAPDAYEFDYTTGGIVVAAMEEGERLFILYKK